MDNTKFRAAIRASGMTLADASTNAGVSMPTMYDRLDNPGQFRLNELKSIYTNLDATGQKLMDEALLDFFCVDYCVKRKIDEVAAS